MKTAPPPITSFDQINWEKWVPDQMATLILIVTGDKILLIRKKRGLGAGKINGPGGRIDPGETPEACAIREAREELHITPTGITFGGELYFQFADGFKLMGHVFRASGLEGTPTETDEATPLWTQVNAIPYHEMWADDRYWLPALLEGRTFRGRFLFEEDTMLGYDLKLSPDSA